ncbi:MAG: DUF4292 domain-containing protein [Ignavibacteriae bacterium]|nr:DUF4292 domain-containing protein [Ignavibacteriota bacterium]
MSARKLTDFFRNSLFLVFACTVFYSCTASQNNNANIEDLTFSELISLVNKNSKKLSSLDADGEISIDSPELSNSGSITVSINKPDSVYTKLEGPFGIDIADLLITRDNFIYYKPMDNTVIKGPSNSHYLGIIMKIQIDFDDIVNAFSGKFIFRDDNYADAKISIEKGNYLMNINTGKEIKKFWIDPDNFFVRKAGTYELSGETKIEIMYDNFYEAEGIYFPKKITIERPKEKQYIWLTYYNEEFNNNKLTYRLKIPKSAKEVIWEGN